MMNEKCLMKAKSTLIVCPDVLVEQWLGEIKKHTMPQQALSYFFYQGIKGHAEKVLEYSFLLQWQGLIRSNRWSVNEKKAIVAICLSLGKRIVMPRS